MHDRALKTLGRVYFILLIPLIGASLAPWVLGPRLIAEMPLFAVWSFTLLIFISGALLGYATGLKSWVYIHGFVCCCVSAVGVTALLLAVKYDHVFAAVALLAFAHWCQLTWLRKTAALSEAFFTPFNRFIWTLLTCHLFVLFNLIYAIKTAGA